MKVVLAEDSGLLRESLVTLLTHFAHEVVPVASADELLAVAVLAEPDVVVTDVRMPPGDGLRAAIELRRSRPTLPVLVLSQHVDTASLRELLETGTAGTGYLLKDRVAHGVTFVEAVESVATGGTVIDETIVARLLVARRDPMAQLSPRELEVLALMAEGHSNAAICARLVISEVTVAKHIGSIFGKLGLPVDESQHRRVLAVLRYLRER
jgi:DNA-binding NarL/FixJ family response regulator